MAGTPLPSLLGHRTQHQESGGLTTCPGLRPLLAPSAVLTLERRTHLSEGVFPAPLPPPSAFPHLLLCCLSSYLVSHG